MQDYEDGCSLHSFLSFQPQDYINKVDAKHLASSCRFDSGARCQGITPICKIHSDSLERQAQTISYLDKVNDTIARHLPGQKGETADRELTIS